MSTVLWTGPRSDPRRYRVEVAGERPIAEPGSGGDGLVYAARSSYGSPDGQERKIALKLKLHLPVVDPAELERRTNILRALDHPHLMRAVDAFIGTALTDDDPSDLDDDAFDLVWVVTAWVDGPRLSAVSISDPRDALTVAAEIARAAEAMHRTRPPGAPAGIVHRDIKPSNIKISPNGAVLIDYGSAGPVDDRWVRDLTPNWMAPEALAGMSPGPAADAWGVGAVVHATLLGRPPAHDGAQCALERLRPHLRAAGLPHADRVAVHVSKLLDTDPSNRPTDLDAWADQLDRLLTSRSGRAGGGWRTATRSATRLVVAAVAVLGVVVGAWIVIDQQATGDATSNRRRSAPNVDEASAQGATTTDAPCNKVVPTATGPIADRLRSAIALLGAGECVDAQPTPFADALVTAITTIDGIPDGVLFAPPDIAVVRLTAAQYASYREIAGRDDPESSSVRYGGYPISAQAGDPTSTATVELSGGGVMIAQRPDTQAFWIPQQARQRWEAQGGIAGALGFPASNPYFTGSGLQQDFERGYVTIALDASGPAGLTSETIEDGQALLTPFGEIRGHVLRQAGGTTWFVDDRSVRHWIGDLETYDCLDAAKRQVPGDVPGPAVFSLGVGAPATCAMADTPAR